MNRKLQLKLLILSGYLPNILFEGLKFFDLVLISLLIFNISTLFINHFNLILFRILGLFVLAFIIFNFSTFFNFRFLEYSSYFSSSSRILRVVLFLFLLNSFGRMTRIELFEFFNFGILILLVNSIISFLEYFNFDLIYIKQIWFNDYYNSVNYNAGTNSRFSGLINQPLESGYLYSIYVLIIQEYRFLYKNKIVSVILTLVLIAGGVLSGSKIFYFIGLPLCLIFIVFKSRYKFLLASILLFLLFSSLFAMINIYPDQFLFLIKIVNSLISSDEIVNTLLGGRLSDPDLTKMFQDVIAYSPIWGFGFGSTRLMDSQFMEFFYQGGFLGTLLLFLILIVIFFHFFKYGSSTGSSLFYKFFFLLFFLSCFGAPVLTMQYAIVPFFLIYFNK